MITSPYEKAKPTKEEYLAPRAFRTPSLPTLTQTNKQTLIKVTNCYISSFTLTHDLSSVHLYLCLLFKQAALQNTESVAKHNASVSAFVPLSYSPTHVDPKQLSRDQRFFHLMSPTSS